MNGPLVRLIDYLPDPLFVAGALLVGGFLVGHLVFRSRRSMRFLCFATAFIAFSIIIVAAGVLPAAPTPATAHVSRFVVISAFKVAWWLTGAWLLVNFFRAMVFLERQPSETRFVQDLFAGIVYISAGLAIISYVFDIPVRGLLAASGVIAIILGLALQSTLGDVFSGVVVNISKPFHAGDWITVDGGLEGQVVEINWRATQILTLSNDLAIVPNSTIAKAKLVNESNPTKAHGITVVIRLEPTMTPSRGYAVLETALLSCNRILRIPAPSVTVRALDGTALVCELQFFVANIELAPAAQNEVFDLIFRHCASAGFRLAPPPEHPFAVAAPRPRRDPDDQAQLLVHHLPLFGPLTEEERAALAANMKRRTYRAGDILIKAGVVSGALSIVTSGALVALQKHGDTEIEIVRLSPGDCFGEAGVLTASPAPFTVKALTRATVYEIGRDDLAPILKERPSVAADLAQILARRTAVGNAQVDHAGEQQPRSEQLVDRIAERIRELFG